MAKGNTLSKPETQTDVARTVNRAIAGASAGAVVGGLGGVLGALIGAVIGGFANVVITEKAISVTTDK